MASLPHLISGPLIPTSPSFYRRPCYVPYMWSSVSQSQHPGRAYEEAQWPDAMFQLCPGVRRHGLLAPTHENQTRHVQGRGGHCDQQKAVDSSEQLETELRVSGARRSWRVGRGYDSCSYNHRFHNVFGLVSLRLPAEQRYRLICETVWMIHIDDVSGYG